MNSITAKENGSYIIFGSGGGFTGEWIYYRINSDGTILSLDNGNEESVIKNEDPKIVRELFDELEKMDFFKIKFLHPGNMSYSIEYITEDQKHKIVWGEYGKNPPQGVTDFYNKLNKLVTLK